MRTATIRLGIVAVALTALTIGCAPERVESPVGPGEDVAEATAAAMDPSTSPTTRPMAEGDEETPAEHAPVPEAAIGVQVPQDPGYAIEEIADGLYWLTEGSYTMMFLVTDEGVVVVDAPPSIGERVLAAIGDVTDQPITHVIYSHTHADHIGAAGMYPADATYIAHQATADGLRDAMSTDRPYDFGTFIGGGPVPLPTVTFDDSYALELGGQVLQLSYHGPNHEAGNTFVYAPAQRTLMVVDVFFPGWVPFKSLALAEDVHGFVEAHDQALEYDFEVLVAGHLNRLGTREDVEVQREYVVDVREAAAGALGSVDFMAIGGEVGFDNTWLLFDTYLNAVAQTCANEVEPQWVDRLGGVDVFTVDHCFKMMESLRID